MNGSNGIVPTVDLATTGSHGYAYPVYPMMGGYGYGNNGFFGGDGIWAIVLIALLFSGNGFGFGGFGGFGGGLGLADGGLLGYAMGNNATKSDLSDGLLGVQTSNKLDNLSTQVSDGFSNAATNLCNVRSDILTGNMGLQNSILSSSCNTQRDILTQTNELNTNLLTSTLGTQSQISNLALSQQAALDKCCCDLRAEGLANTQRILDTINNNTIQDLRDKLATANNQLSDQAVISAVRPYPIPSYLVSSPYSSIYNGFGWNNGFYGNGFFGNTIV